MTELTINRTDYSADDRRWIRDHTGFRATVGVTLNGSLFSALRFPDGTVPSGTVLAAVEPDEPGGSSLWGPYDPAATDGRESAEPGRVGFLLEARQVRPGARVSTALLDHGRIETRYLPTSPIGGAVGLLDDDVRAAVAAEFLDLPADLPVGGVVDVNGNS